MPFELEPLHRNVPDEDLLADIRRVAGGRRSLTMADYRENGRFGRETIRKRFGSWNAALARAGLTITKAARIPDAELFTNIAALWTLKGRQPRRSEVVKPHSAHSSSVYEVRFGTWRKALEAFVSFANSGEPQGAPSGPAPTRRRGPRQPDLRLRFTVLRRDRFQCVQCGAAPNKDPRVRLHVDHVIPWSRGGDTRLDNLRTLCEGCNLGKGALHAEEA
jgi:hypothetical protein